jgi:purine-binding chemotaxis protein CheW
MLRLKPGSSREGDSFDWQAIRERLARAADGEVAVDPEERERVLHERALRLARPQLMAAGDTAFARLPDAIEVVSFQLGNESYAIESRYVHQVLMPGALTRVPGAPSQLRGVTNVRGEIMPVFDLRELLEAERTAAADSARWLLLGEAVPELCLWADAVEELCAIDPSALSAPGRDNRPRHAFVRGVTRDARSVLDGAALLSDRQLFAGDAPGVVMEGLK